MPRRFRVGKGAARLAPLLLGAAGAYAPSAAAQTSPEPALRLTWDAPRGCPSSDEVAARVERLLAGVERPVHFTARARVERHAQDDFRVEVTTDDGTTRGQRMIRTDSCKAAAEATVVVVVLAMAPEKGSTPSATSTSTSTSLATNCAIPDRRIRGLTWLAGARTLVGFGQVPGATSGLGLFYGFQYGAAFRVEALAQIWLPRHASAPDSPSIGATFFREAIDLRACYLPRLGPLNIGACLGARAGKLFAKGFGVSTPLEGEETQLGPLAGALVTWPLSKGWALRAEGDLALQMLERPPFVILESAPLYQSPRVSADAALGIERRF